MITGSSYKAVQDGEVSRLGGSEGGYGPGALVLLISSPPDIFFWNMRQ